MYSGEFTTHLWSWVLSTPLPLRCPRGLQAAGDAVCHQAVYKWPQTGYGRPQCWWSLHLEWDKDSCTNQASRGHSATLDQASSAYSAKVLEPSTGACASNGSLGCEPPNLHQLSILWLRALLQLQRVSGSSPGSTQMQRREGGTPVNLFLSDRAGFTQWHGSLLS